MIKLKSKALLLLGIAATGLAAGYAQAGSVEPGTKIMQLEDGLSAVRYDGDYWFDRFLEQGGASNDSGVVDFLTGQLRLGEMKPVFQTTGFGCHQSGYRKNGCHYNHSHSSSA